MTRQSVEKNYFRLRLVSGGSFWRLNQLVLDFTHRLISTDKIQLLFYDRDIIESAY